MASRGGAGRWVAAVAAGVALVLATATPALAVVSDGFSSAPGIAAHSRYSTWGGGGALLAADAASVLVVVGLGLLVFSRRRPGGRP